MNFLNKNLWRWQWRILRRERIVQIAVGLLLLACGYALFNGLTEANSQHRDVLASQAYQSALFDKTRQSLAAFEQKTPSEETARSAPNAAAAVRDELANFKAVLPPAPAAPLAVGQSDLYSQAFYYRKYNEDSPSQATVDGRSLSNVFPQKLTANPMRLLTGRFDLAFVLVYIFPLLIIALSFNLVTAEAEAGTLALFLSQPVSLKTLVLSKTMLRFALVMVTAIVLPAFGVALGGFMTQKSLGFWRLLVWCLAALGYGLFWFALALLVNRHGRGSARNALLLAVGWLCVVVAIPILSGLVAQVLFPLPSSLMIADKERAFRTEAQEKATLSSDLLRANFAAKFPPQPDEKTASPRLNALRNSAYLNVPTEDQLLTAYFRRHPEWQSQLTYGRMIFAIQQARDEYIEEQLFPLLATVESQRTKQERLVHLASLFSPAIILQKVISEVAGTSAARHENFVRQFDEYVRQRNQFFATRVFQGQPIAAAEINTLPKFAFREESPNSLLRRVALSFVLLLLLPLALLSGAIRLYRKQTIAEIL